MSSSSEALETCGRANLQHINAVSLAVLEDVNQDGSVSFLDISPFIEYLAKGTCLKEADGLAITLPAEPVDKYDSVIMLPLSKIINEK